MATTEIRHAHTPHHRASRARVCPPRTTGTRAQLFIIVETKQTNKQRATLVDLLPHTATAASYTQKNCHKKANGDDKKKDRQTDYRGASPPCVQVALAEVVHGQDYGVQDDAHHHRRVEPRQVYQPEAQQSETVWRGLRALHRPQAAHDQLRLDPQALVSRHQQAALLRTRFHLNSGNAKVAAIRDTVRRRMCDAADAERGN